MEPIRIYPSKRRVRAFEGDARHVRANGIASSGARQRQFRHVRMGPGAYARIQEPLSSTLAARRVSPSQAVSAAARGRVVVFRRGKNGTLRAAIDPTSQSSAVDGATAGDMVPQRRLRSVQVLDNAVAVLREDTLGRDAVQLLSTGGDPRALFKQDRIVNKKHIKRIRAHLLRLLEQKSILLGIFEQREGQAGDGRSRTTTSLTTQHFRNSLSLPVDDQSPPRRREGSARRDIHREEEPVESPTTAPVISLEQAAALDAPLVIAEIDDRIVALRAVLVLQQEQEGLEQRLRDEARLYDGDAKAGGERREMKRALLKYEDSDNGSSSSSTHRVRSGSDATPVSTPKQKARSKGAHDGPTAPEPLPQSRPFRWLDERHGTLSTERKGQDALWSPASQGADSEYADDLLGPLVVKDGPSRSSANLSDDDGMSPVHANGNGGGNFKVDQWGDLATADGTMVSAFNGLRRGDDGDDVAGKGGKHMKKKKSRKGNGVRKRMSKSKKKKVMARDARRENKWENMMATWDTFTVANAAKFKSRVRKGIAMEARCEAWVRMTGAGKRAAEHKGLYAELVARTPDKSDDIQIRKDLPRQHQHHIKYRSPEAGSRIVVSKGQLALYNVLKAYSIYDREIGYVQGMGHVAAICLMYVDEEHAFWMIERLLRSPKYNLYGLYTPGLPLVFEYEFVLQGLFKKKLPKLFRHFAKNEIVPTMYAFRWLTTRFSNFPTRLVVRIYDIYFYEGMKIIYRMCLYLLQKHRAELLRGDLSVIVQLLSNLYQHPDMLDADAVIAGALEVDITTKQMNVLTEKYRAQLAYKAQVDEIATASGQKLNLHIVSKHARKRNKE